MKNNEPAFPCTFYDRDSTGEYQPREQLSGMSLRDYFAAKAMQAIITKKPYRRNRSFADRDTTEDLAVAYGAYFYADAMLKAREE